MSAGPVIARAVLALCLASALVGQQDDVAETVFQSDTRLVEVTVVATDRNGVPIRDLALEDIRLLDNGDEQRVQSFERAATRSEAIRRPCGFAFRHSVILIDGVNTDRRDQVLLQKALAQVLKNVDAQDERIAVFLYWGDVVVLQNFLYTAGDLAALAEDLSDAAIYTPPSKWRSDGGWFWPRMFSGELQREDALQRRATGTLSALGISAESIAHIPGQKNLIWISAGFPITEKEETAQGGQSDSTWQRHSRPVEKRLKSSRAVSAKEVEMMTRTLNASNVNLYPIDARGLTAVADSDDRIGVMKHLAARTGGLAYYNDNNLAAMVEAALNDSRDSYVLSYSPNNFDEKKPVHKITVVAERAGIKLRYRPTYYADWRKFGSWRAMQVRENRPVLPSIPLWAPDFELRDPVFSEPTSASCGPIGPEDAFPPAGELEKKEFGGWKL